MAPDRPVLLTFFSPSGREAVRCPQADHVDYLPFDTPKAAQRFAQCVKPADTVLVKYELWPNLITALHQSGTRIHLIAARFDAGPPPHQPLGWLDPQRQLGAWPASTSKTPRHNGCSRLWTGQHHLATHARTGFLTSWTGKRQKRWVSHWTASESGRESAGCCSLAARGTENGMHFAPFGNNGRSRWAFLVAPHDIQGGRVDQWCSSAEVIRFSDHAESTLPASAGLVLDRVGCLRDGYALADLAVVGGGGHNGVHNTMEPAAHGVPIAVGPNVAGFREIAGLESAGALTVCATEASLVEWLEAWTSPDAGAGRSAKGRAAKAWVTEHRGAAERIAMDVLARGGANRMMTEKQKDLLSEVLLNERETRLELATPTLARLCSTN